MEQLLTTLGSWLEALPDGSTSTDVLRFVFPLLAIAIVARCAASLLTFRREPEVLSFGRAGSSAPAAERRAQRPFSQPVGLLW